MSDVQVKRPVVYLVHTRRRKKTDWHTIAGVQQTTFLSLSFEGFRAYWRLCVIIICLFWFFINEHLIWLDTFPQIQCLPFWQTLCLQLLGVWLLCCEINLGNLGLKRLIFKKLSACCVHLLRLHIYKRSHGPIFERT